MLASTTWPEFRFRNRRARSRNVTAIRIFQSEIVLPGHFETPVFGSGLASRNRRRAAAAEIQQNQAVSGPKDPRAPPRTPAHPRAPPPHSINRPCAPSGGMWRMDRAKMQTLMGIWSRLTAPRALEGRKIGGNGNKRVIRVGGGYKTEKIST